MCVQFCMHPEMLENCSKASGGTTDKVRGVKHMACEERLWKKMLFSLGKKKAKAGFNVSPPHLKEAGSYRNRARPYQMCTVVR